MIYSPRFHLRSSNSRHTSLYKMNPFFVFCHECCPFEDLKMAHTDERALSVVFGSGEGAVNMRRYRNHPHRKVPASSRFLCFSCLDLEFCELYKSITDLLITDFPNLFIIKCVYLSVAIGQCLLHSQF